MSRLLKNIRYTTIEYAFNVLGLIVNIFLIRYLGPDRYGIYAFYLSILGILSIVTMTALDSLIIRDRAKGDCRDDHLGALLVLKTIGAVAIVVFMVIYHFLYIAEKGVSLQLTIIASLTSFIALVILFKNVFVAAQAIKTVVTVNLVFFFLSMTAKIVGILVGMELEYFFLAIVVIDILAAGIVWRVKLRNIVKLQWGKLLESMVYMLKSGWPLLVTSLSVLLFMKIDQVMIFHMISEEATGQYGTAIWFTEKFMFFSPLIMVAFFPYLSSIHDQDKEQFNYAARIGLKVFALIAFPVCIFFSAWGEEIVLFFFGRKFQPAGAAASLIPWSLVFIYWGAINQKVLVIRNDLKTDMLYATTSAMVNIVCNYFFIREFGILGAALATVLGHSMYFWLQMFHRNMRVFNLYMLASVPFPLFAALLGLLAARIVDAGLLLSFAIYLGSYALAVLLLSRQKISQDYATIRRLLFEKYLPRAEASK